MAYKTVKGMGVGVPKLAGTSANGSDGKDGKVLARPGPAQVSHDLSVPPPPKVKVGKYSGGNFVPPKGNY